MLNDISNNPYRVLGVYSNSPIKERVANANRLKAFLRVGKNLEFPSDMSVIIGPLTRSQEMMETANASLNLLNDRIKYAFTWFIEVTPIDKIALSYLQKGDVAKCKDLLSKKENFSSLVNLAVIDFIDGKLFSTFNSNRELYLEYPKNENGTVNLDKMTPEQEYAYVLDREGMVAAQANIRTHIAKCRARIEELHKKTTDQTNENVEQKADLLFDYEQQKNDLTVWQSLLLNTIDGGVDRLTKLVAIKEYRDEFVSAVIGEPTEMEEETLASLLVEVFVGCFDAQQILKIGSCSNSKLVKDVISKRILDEYRNAILSAINESNEKSDTYKGYLEAGKKLIEDTKTCLANLKQLLGEQDMSYQIVADKLAAHILQCGINCFNRADDMGESEHVMDDVITLTRYSVSVAIGKVTKDRCKSNLEILERRKRKLAVDDDFDALGSLIGSLRNTSASLSNARSFIEKAQVHLMHMKEVLGIKDSDYIAASSAVANGALNMVITVANREQNRYVANTSREIIEIILKMDLDVATKERVRKNYEIIKQNCSVGKPIVPGPKFQRSDSFPPNFTPTKSKFEELDESTDGCLSKFIYFGVIFAIMFLVTLCTKGC